MSFPESGIIIGLPRNPELKATKSYSCNLLIRAYHSNQELKKTPFKNFVEEMQAKPWPLHVKIESSGYITIIDMEQAAVEPKVKNVIVEKPKVEEEVKVDPKSLEFKEFFDEL